MANYATLKAAIQDVIKTNGNNEITGALLQQSLLAMIASLGANYQFAGVALPNTDPGTPDQNVCYFAATDGIYSNFGSISLLNGECAFLAYNGTWQKMTVGLYNKQFLSKIVDELCGVQLEYSQQFSAAGRANCFPNIQIAKGEKFRVKISSPNAEWSRAAIFSGTRVATNNIWDNLINNVEYEFVAIDDINGLILYVVSLTTPGLITVNLRTFGRVDKLEDSVNKMESFYLLSPNLLDKNDRGYLPNRILPNYAQNSSYDTSGFIPVEYGKTYVFSNNGVETSMRYICQYLDQHSAPQVTTQNVSRITISDANIKFIRFSFLNSYEFPQFEQGTEPTEYQPFGQQTFDGEKIHNKSIGGEKLKDSTVGVDKIADDAKVVIVGKNLLNPDVCVSGYLNPNTGLVNSSSSYGTTDFIPVIAGQDYYYSCKGSQYLARYVCFYNQQKAHLGSSYALQNVQLVPVPVGAAFMRLSYYATATDLQIEKGNSATEYEAYFGTSSGFKVADHYIENKHLKNNSVNTNNVLDESITETKLSVEVREKLGSLKPNYYTYRGNLTNGQTVVLGSNSVKNNKRLSFTATIGVLGSLTLGHGTETQYLASWLVIDGTNITRYIHTTSTSSQARAHGLTITNNIQIQLVQENASTIKVTITSNGQTFTTEFSWFGCHGDIYATLADGGTLNDCVFSWSCKGYKQDIWAFGDSYFSLDALDRWPAYLIQAGNTNLILNAFSGENSATALQDLNGLIVGGTPKKIFWCLGMNDPDSSAGINGSWLDVYNSVKELCGQKGIELILATIPNTPTQRHTYKNQIVRESGYRYVDFATAVNANSVGAPWYDGMLSTDNVHPTVMGAITLYGQAVADFPELTTV